MKMKREIKESYIPMGSGKYAEKSLANEFWTDFLFIFSSADSIIGIFISIILAILFIFKWLLFLIEKFILRMNVEKPKNERSKIRKI